VKERRENRKREQLLVSQAAVVARQHRTSSPYAPHAPTLDAAPAVLRPPTRDVMEV
jgi:hypothetical protein